MATSTLHVEVVSAERSIWSGEAVNIIARTVDGDIGILPGHSPVVALLQPSAVEIYTPEGNREIVAVDDGFISVAQGRVSILSSFARLGGEIDLAEAEREYLEAKDRLDHETDDVATREQMARARAQVRAAEKFTGKSSAALAV
ncbi:F-type H+-transporting ATPase subunit epsilon [Raineyella antarctica]|uniref:ATP synthase epsilon chain n=1 Tax=Raineyella antarctica TaxID=1577474 RepID=A0A1G6GU61_9ACTN|nr:F0F1 ATP synthase subunit epsilon [Raineyella antarctica]SDB85570.1 F-type H+-transporting ATPase subunit epsilon [Raineyella antarctica]